MKHPFDDPIYSLNPPAAPAREVRASPVKPAEKPSARPWGVFLLGSLHAIAGSLLVVLSVLFLLAVSVKPLPVEASPRSVHVAMIAFVISGSVALASGLGLLGGKAWGWRLGIFHYVWMLFQNGGEILAVLLLPSAMDALQTSMPVFLFKHGGRMIVSCLLLKYLFQGHVMRHFAVEEVEPKILLHQYGRICAAIYFLRWWMRG